MNNWPKISVKSLIICYRYTLGYFFPPDSCRFHPTCSQYALDSVDKFGPFKGGLLSLYRVLRCNPWNRGGYDPIK